MFDEIDENQSGSISRGELVNLLIAINDEFNQNKTRDKIDEEAEVTSLACLQPYSEKFHYKYCILLCFSYNMNVLSRTHRQKDKKNYLLLVTSA